MFDISAVSLIFQPLFLLKILFLIFIFFYVIFTFIILNQVQGMNKIITNISFSTVIKIIALLNLIIAFSLFLYVLVIL